MIPWDWDTPEERLARLPCDGYLSMPFARLSRAITIAAPPETIFRWLCQLKVEGFGTPVPMAAPERLVVGGPYRYVRNPMYVAILAAIIGQALFLSELRLLLVPAALRSIVAAFVRWHEEPALLRRFGRLRGLPPDGSRLVAPPAAASFPTGTVRGHLMNTASSAVLGGSSQAGANAHHRGKGHTLQAPKKSTARAYH